MKKILDKLFVKWSLMVENYYSHRGGRKRLQHSISPDTSVVCNNCFGSKVSQTLGYSYNSPTVGLYFMLPDYIEFIKHLNYYRTAPLNFKSKSRYGSVNEERRKRQYPIGQLLYKDREVEIEFLHYKSPQEAKEKWERRCLRINMDKLLIIGSEVDGCRDEDVDSFMNLPYDNKLFFGRKKRIYANLGYHYTGFLNSQRFTNLYNQAHLFFKYLCHLKLNG